ncbi:uncharacterized protein LOC6564559 [Drosophila grimshawi]|uniref:uncharacterized protein LOC6564559 n=1 Tax=Drosophila grimshawi TaxID=7222 RepID=UPI000C870D95|nr:uncharacterized protein LOC6564559 [Drosophila grimshawi]
MRSIIICCALLSLVLLMRANGAQAADCVTEDTGITGFFKTLGCKVKQGAEDVADAAKPYTDKIGEGAKELGSSVAQKYDELKHRLTDDASTPKTSVAYDAPTERVPLAPIAPSVPADLVSSTQPIA